MNSVLSFFLKCSLKQPWIQINHTLWGIPLNDLLKVWEAFGRSCWMSWSGQIIGEKFSTPCQVLYCSTQHYRSVFYTLQKAEVQWQSMMDLSKYLSNREQWYETILQDSVACRECCWPWSHLSNVATPWVSSAIASFKHELEKKKPQTFKETYFQWGIISRWKLVEKGLWFLQL